MQNRKSAGSLFPQLSVTTYTCADLFSGKTIAGCRKKVDRTSIGYFFTAVTVVGMPLRVDNQLFNVAVVLQGGRILGLCLKQICPITMSFTKNAGLLQQNLLISLQ